MGNEIRAAGSQSIKFKLIKRRRSTLSPRENHMNHISNSIISHAPRIVVGLVNTFSSALRCIRIRTFEGPFVLNYSVRSVQRTFIPRR